MKPMVLCALFMSCFAGCSSTASEGDGASFPEADVGIDVAPTPGLGDADIATESDVADGIAARGDALGDLDTEPEPEPAPDAAPEPAPDAAPAPAPDAAPAPAPDAAPAPVVCPDDPPGVGLPRRFDVITFKCPEGGTCGGEAAQQDKCLCQPEFAHLNDVEDPHFILSASDKHKAQIWAAGNRLGVYIDDLNTNWEAGGAARADAVMEAAAQQFPCGVPKWFLANEISHSKWQGDEQVNIDYRQFVVDFAERLADHHDRLVIVTAPFATPGGNNAAWQALAEHAWVAAQHYLSGAEINQAGNQQGWCEDRYTETMDAYEARGVPKERLMLVEHFGNTTPDKGWGRAGASVQGWINAITVRTLAAASLDFAGFISYAWGSNLMHETEENRLAFEDAYVAASAALP
ncbi:MAG: hypothetical protein QF464_19845 [Myxococcota bacterium]|nr:hypothetical protein [Myxococcota bacterium]